LDSYIIKIENGVLISIFSFSLNGITNNGNFLSISLSVTVFSSLYEDQGEKWLISCPIGSVED
jgi:hypothetical protein